MSNLRLVLMALACGVAALTHFNGQPFPENRGIMLAAILGYAAISAALQLTSWFIDGNALIYTKPAKVSCLQFGLFLSFTWHFFRALNLAIYRHLNLLCTWSGASMT